MDEPLLITDAPHAAGLPAAAWGWLLAYGVLIVGVSLVGGWIPGRLKLTHPQFQHVLSLVAGLMLGVAMLHLLPHAVAAGTSADLTCQWALAGIMIMFLMLRALHFHVHEPAPLLEDEPGVPGPLAVAHECASPGHSHDHDHDATPTGRLGWAGMFFGMGVHTLADGVALGAALAAALSHRSGAVLPGFGIFAAVALHKPLDAMSLTALMQRDGWSARGRTLANAAVAVLCPVGAAVVLWGQSGGLILPTGPLLGFSAGVFICIALSDLLPEMEFHSHDRFTLTVALLAGIALAAVIRLLEPGHLHG